MHKRYVEYRKGFGEVMDMFYIWQSRCKDVLTMSQYVFQNTVTTALGSILSRSVPTEQRMPCDCRYRCIDRVHQSVGTLFFAIEDKT